MTCTLPPVPVIERARRYAAHLPPSVEDHGGSAALFKAAVTLIRGFDLPADDAWPLLCEWNQTHGQPPWQEKDLRRKIAEAEKSPLTPGYLLSSTDKPHAPRTPRPTTPTPAADDDAVTAAKHRQAWPTFRPLTDGELIRIGNLRKVALHAVRSFNGCGFMSYATVKGHPCFIIHENTFAQARRFDGGLLPTAEGPRKAKTLRGSRGAFLGHGHSWLGGKDHKVLMIEGCIGMLEALTALLYARPPSLWTIVGAISCGSKFERDPALLKALAGRFVRIVADTGKAGVEGAGSWLADLEAAGCNVEVILPPHDESDLGPLVAQPTKNKQALESLFT
jgi:hypothetical protein